MSCELVVPTSHSIELRGRHIIDDSFEGNIHFRILDPIIVVQLFVVKILKNWRNDGGWIKGGLFVGLIDEKDDSCDYNCCDNCPLVHSPKSINYNDHSYAYKYWRFLFIIALKCSFWRKMNIIRMTPTSKKSSMKKLERSWPLT